MESPECTPVLSTSSMMPGTNTSLPSHTASTSTSLPRMYLSTSTGLSTSISTAVLRYVRSASSFATICIALPPSTKLGRTSTGNPISFAASTPASMLVTAIPLGLGISSSYSSFSNRSLSSARSIASSSVPMSLTSYSFNESARLMAV